MNISINLEFKVRGLGTLIKSREPNFTLESSLCLTALCLLVRIDFSKKTRKKGLLFLSMA